VGDEESFCISLKDFHIEMVSAQMFRDIQNVMSIYFIAETSLLLQIQEPCHSSKGCYVAAHQLSSELNSA
jgi:hypothetical protein